MNTKICTSVEQSKKLIELGIDTSSADMYWNASSDNGENYSEFPTCELATQWDIPAWSLSALLELMPKELEDDLDLYYGAFDGRGEYHPVWVCSCMNRVDFGDTSIDAVFKVVCWILENRKI